MRALPLALVALLLAGCMSGPAYVKCKGKGSVSGQGHISGGYGGANMFTLTADCGEQGFEYQQGVKPPKAP